ncbi:hypothetical protein [Desulforamulus aquiferis]|uniref:CpXC domain-containing protein n=1 Tax=Desulforamulus aquiferis TaxID=1397668 RepID=A0AAW7ZA15_9FIRM|nr:hypothetical protein [Desulforamulus aquiferis]MDO7786305.1 hypothetical protein [Desulforamulus aquiferis]RYD04999.1 hypothetical protein N752_11590 [Desulforamulus aquiferis]
MVNNISYSIKTICPSCRQVGELIVNGLRDYKKVIEITTQYEDGPKIHCTFCNEELSLDIITHLTINPRRNGYLLS